jgi:transposase
LHASGNLLQHKITKNEKGEIKRENRRYDLQNLEKDFIKTLNENDYVCVEAGTGTFKLVKKLEKHVKKIIVINPMDFKAIYMTGKKTDKIDAKKLAEVLRFHIETNDEVNEFPEVYVPEEEIIKMRNLFSTYDLLKKQITSLRNRLRSIIRNELIQLKCRDICAYLKTNLNKLNLDEINKQQIQTILSIIEKVEIEIKEIEKTIIKLGLEHYETEIKNLISIDGISIFTSCAIISDIGDIKRFKNAKKLCSYLRSAPKIDSSNKKTYIGKINKRGRKRTFTMILQGLQHIIRNNLNYKNFYDRKTKGKSKGKVRSALVRKTIVAIFYMLKNNENWKFANNLNYERKIKELVKYKKLLKTA